MSRPSPADAVPPRAVPAQRAAASALAPRKRRVVWQLIVLVTIPAVLGLAVAGLRVTDAMRSAGAYRLVGRLAVLGQQVNGLAQAMADERSGTATFIAGGRTAAGLEALHRQYAITDDRAAGVRQMVLQLGRGYPAQTRASAAKVLASIAELPALRAEAAQGRASALAVITGYSAAASGLFPVADGIADPGGNSALITSVRALGSLSRMTDQASQQQAILRVALAEGRFGPGALTALLTAQARQASDLASFRGSAAPEESWALTKTLASPLARQAQAVEQSATGAGNGPLALGAQAGQRWWAGMSYTVGWMRDAQQQLTGWITSYAQAQQRKAVRSAIITGGAALAGLVLVLLATIFVARSMVGRLRRLEAAAAQEAAAARAREQAPRPAGTSAISANFFQRSHSQLERLMRLIDSLELSEEDPERLASLFQMDHLATRMWRNADSALVLAGHETPRRSTGPLSLVDVLRAAVSEIEQYDRVVLDIQQGVCVSETAATDTAHLLAELLENATRFSPGTAQVVVSGRTVRGGGSRISIADSGKGMPREQLKKLNWQLAHPPRADVAVAGPVGLFAVAHLAARHGITVRLSTPPGGGTTAEVSLPAALISPDTRPDRWLRPAGEALPAGNGAGAGARAAAELPFSPLRLTAGPEPSLQPETDAREDAPLMLGAPASSPAPEASFGAAGPPEIEASASFGAAGAPGTEASASFGAAGPGETDGSSGAAEHPALNGTAAGMPGRIPQPRHARGVAAGQQALDEQALDEQAADGEAAAAGSAELMRSRLASFQRGSRRARSEARASRDARQPSHHG